MSSVDVVVPCYKYGHFLEKCIHSVLSQSGVDVRVRIIDDASPDNTNQVAEQLAGGDARVTVSTHARNAGHIATYNEGLAWASADYVLLLSADDYLLPGALERAVKLLDAHPAMVFAFGQALETRGGEDPIEVAEPMLDVESIRLPACKTPDGAVLSGLDFLNWCCLHGASNMVPTPTAVIRTRIQHQVGGYRPELPHSADMELWMRLAAHGDVGVISPAQAVYRKHAGNMSHAYYSDARLSDLRQRKSAIDTFVASFGSQERFEAVGRDLYRALALAAVGLASAAFNANRIALSMEISGLAREIDPSVESSRPWSMLRWKRRIGPRLSNALLRVERLLRPSITRQV